MLQTIGQYLSEGSGNKVDTSLAKMVYIAPMKALVQETVNNFRRRLTLRCESKRIKWRSGSEQR